MQKDEQRHKQDGLGEIGRNRGWKAVAANHWWLGMCNINVILTHQILFVLFCKKVDTLYIGMLSDLRPYSTRSTTLEDKGSTPFLVSRWIIRSVPVYHHRHSFRYQPFFCGAAKEDEVKSSHLAPIRRTGARVCWHNMYIRKWCAHPMILTRLGETERGWRLASQPGEFLC